MILALIVGINSQPHTACPISDAKPFNELKVSHFNTTSGTKANDNEIIM